MCMYMLPGFLSFTLSRTLVSLAAVDGFVDAFYSSRYIYASTAFRETHPRRTHGVFAHGHAGKFSFVLVSPIHPFSFFFFFFSAFYLVGVYHGSN